MGITYNLYICTSNFDKILIFSKYMGRVFSAFLLFFGLVFSLLADFYNENNCKNNMGYRYNYFQQRYEDITVNFIYQDSKGYLWLSIEPSGLYKFDGTHINTFSVDYDDSSKLSNNYKYFYNKDSMVSYLYNPNGKTCNRYTKENGLQGNIFPRGACKCKSEKIIFGGGNGFNYFNPYHIKIKENNNKVGINYISINDEIKFQDITEDLSITLNAKENNLAFEFAFLDYSSAKDNSYSYILEGLDESVTHLGQRNFVSYPNLKPGHYKLKVTASNLYLDKSKNAPVISIYIKPPLWSTLGFKIAAILVLLALIWLLIRQRIKVVNRRNIELEKQIKERTLELYKANKELIVQKEEIEKQRDNLESSYKNLSILSEFGHRITESLNLVAINKMIYSYVSSLMDTSVFGIGVYNPEQQHIRFYSLMEDNIPIPDFMSDLHDETSCAAWCFRYQEIILSNDFEHDYRKYITRMHIRSSRIPQSLIYMPLNVENKKIGIITVQSYNKNAYQDKDLSALKSLAAYIAIVLDNANAYEIVKEQFVELEQHRHHLGTLIKKRTSELKSAKEKAEESDRLKTAFLANMSHEIRTPLNAIVGFAHLLASDRYTHTNPRKIHNIIQSNSLALLKLINDILDFAKIEAGQLDITKSRIKVNEVLQEIEHAFNEELKRSFKNIGEHIDLRANKDNLKTSFILYTDPIRLRQIFNNLISNSIKFTKKGIIEFGYKILEEQKMVEFYVKDTGIGIDKENISKIFERFRKIDEDQSHLYRGTGLGLSISKSLIEMLGGEIRLKSKLHKGTTFYFTIPLIETKLEPKSATPAASYTQITKWPGKHLLIVEDEDSNFDVLRNMLYPSEIHVDRAENGKEAITMVKNTNYHLVLMDIRLPVMDGITAISKIRKFDKDIPIIAQTAYVLPEDQEKIINAGFSEYISKPILLNDLLNKISKFLS